MSCWHGWNIFGTLLDCPTQAAGAVAGAAGHAVGSLFSAGLESVMSWLSNMMLDAISTILKTLGTFWVGIKTPTDALKNTRSSAVGWLWHHLGWYAAAILVFSVLFGAGKMAFTRRAEPGIDVLKGIGTYLLVAGAGLPTLVLLVGASDVFSSWIIDQATGEDFRTGLGRMLNFNVAAEALTLILLVILGLFAVLASIVQIVLMVMRSAMLVILAGILPLSATALNTEIGKRWFARMLAWLLAFLLYKPVASIIYALAFRLLSGNSGGNPVVSVIMGITLMVLSLLALPALMRFLVPAAAATAGGSGFGAVLGAAVATGAAVVGGRMLLGAGKSGGSGGGGGGTAGSAPGSGGTAGPSGSGGAAGSDGPSGGTGPSGGGGPSGGAGGATGSTQPGGTGSGGGRGSGAGAAAGTGTAAGAGAAVPAMAGAAAAAGLVAKGLSAPGDATGRSSGQDEHK